MVDQCAHQLVADDEPLGRPKAAIQAKARNFGDAGTARHLHFAQLGIEFAENVRAPRVQQTRRSEMTSLPVSEDQITGMDVIELVDLEAPGEHRHVPAEQIHENAFARLEHGGENRTLGATPTAFEYVQHVSNLRSHGLRAAERASWLAAICPEMGISATEEIGRAHV